MCLTAIGKPKIAIEDIVIYKILKKDLTSPFKNFQYELNKLYEDDSEITFETIPFVSEVKFLGPGFYHSYIDKESAYKTLQQMNKYQDHKLYKGIIPEGTKYYQGYMTLKDQVASKAIIINECIS